MTPDMELALIVSSLFRDMPHKPRGTLLWPDKAERLAADRALSAYFSEADAWDEETARMTAPLMGTCPKTSAETP